MFENRCMLSRFVRLLVVLMIFESPLALMIDAARVVVPVAAAAEQWYPCLGHGCGCTPESCFTNCCCRKPRAPTTRKTAPTETCCPSTSINPLAFMACNSRERPDEKPLFDFRRFLPATTAPFWSRPVLPDLRSDMPQPAQCPAGHLFRPPRSC